MKSTTIFLLCLLALPLAPAGAGQELPLRIDARPELETKEPLWVAEEIAVKNGELDWSLFDEGSRWSFSSMLREAPEPSSAEPTCLQKVRRTWYCGVEGGNPRSLGQLLAQPEVVISGQIVGTLRGFYTGFPATLIQVQATETVRSPGNAAISDRINLIVPVAQIRVAGRLLCSEDSQHPQGPPRAGSRVVVFLRSGYPRAPGELIDPAGYELIREMETGGLEGPDLIAEELRGLAFDQLLKLVRGANGESHD